VGDFKSAKPVASGSFFEPATRGWITKDRTVPGHIGEPHLASAEKGESLFRVFSDDVAGLLERVLAWNGRDWNDQ
jgi:creatinine amidohydrolase